jgi:hypothetical protein
MVFILLLTVIAPISMGNKNVMTNEKPLMWWNNWPDFPGRYEPMFEVSDIFEFDHAVFGLTIADFNDDGFIDFAVTHAKHITVDVTISIFYSDGNISFVRDDIYSYIHPDPDVHIRGVFDDLISGDFDLDGDIDLICSYNEIKSNSYTNGTVNILFNEGDNNFSEIVMIAKHLKLEDGRKRINPQLTSDDFDNDGDLDLLVGDNSGLIEFFKNDGTGKFISAGVYDLGLECSWGVSSGDFDNDDDIDFIATQNVNIDTGYVYLFWNDGTTSCFNQTNYLEVADLPPRASFFSNPILGWGCLCSIDYNDDEMMDFIFSGGESVFLFIQKENWVFDYFHLLRLPETADEDGGFFFDDLRLGGIAVGDFDNDGLDDMVLGGAHGFVRIGINKLVLADIVKPDEASLFISNLPQSVSLMDPIMIYDYIKNGISIAIGRLTVEAKALAPLQKMEFYLNNKLVHTDDSEPYEWKWESLSFGRKTIKALPYTLDGEPANFDEAIVLKYF